jgi:uracil-DNA glycosylase
LRWIDCAIAAQADGGGLFATGATEYDTGMSQTDPLRARARMALRAERAFGLTLLPTTGENTQEPASAPPAAIPVPAVAPRPSVTHPAVVPPAPPAVPAPKRDLFGVQLSPSPVAISTPFTSAVLPVGEKASLLKSLNDAEVSVCRKCRLCEARTNTVFGEGNPDSRIVFIGEGPGENEDLQGRPFVGRAGELLNKWIGAMGLKREQVFIANIVKCRPPGNRVPAPDEIAACTPYLERQLETIRPQVIITLGLPATKYMLQTESTMGRMRGRWHEWRGIKLMPTYHPAYLLRNYTRDTRAAVWSDLQQVMAELGLPIPKRAGEEQS